MAPTLKQSALADTSALVVDGNTPTTVAGDDYGHLSSKALKRLCTERGLAVRGDHAALVGEREPKLQFTTMQVMSLSHNETMQKIGSKTTCECKFKQNNNMQHYKKCVAPLCFLCLKLPLAAFCAPFA
jgi:hypothetical protein